VIIKIFITGGAGFIGRNLVRLLISEGNTITIFDDLSNSSEELISDLIQSGVLFIKKDIRDFDSVDESILGHELVIHMAAKTSVKESISNSQNTMDVNVNGTKNLLDACIKHNIKKIITISSTAVYGNIKDSSTKIREDFVPNPVSLYGKSKLMMEELVTKYTKENQLDSIILRLFNVCGLENSHEFSGVISQYGKKILEEKPLKINGDGIQTRDFVSLIDILDAIQKSILKISGMRAKVFNIGSGISISINELANNMMEIYGKKLDIIHFDSVQGDVKFSNTSIDLAKEHLGYYPKISLRDGLTRLISSFS